MATHITDFLWLATRLSPIAVIFLLIFSHLGGPDKVKPSAPPPKRLANFRAIQSLKERDRRLARLKIKPFPFTTLPRELQLLILSYASHKTARQTFFALLLVSKDIRGKTLVACIPHIPILLTTRQRLLSFHKFCVNNPEDNDFPGVAKLVKCLWISPSEAEDLLPSSRVLKRCINVVSVGCNAWLLKEAICSQEKLVHQRCRSLTLLMSDENWESNIPTQMRKTFGAFFRQVTHLQVAADALVPRRLSCSSLTHLSFACSPEESDSIVKLVTNAKRYPRLDTVVVTQWQQEDERVVVVQEANPWIAAYYAPEDGIDAKHWDEGVDVWERAGKALRRTSTST